MDMQAVEKAPTDEVPAALLRLGWPWLVRITWHVSPDILGHPRHAFEPARSEAEAVDRAVLTRDRCGSRLAAIHVMRVEVRELRVGAWRTIT
jgi:hypothetical protein